MPYNEKRYFLKNSNLLEEMHKSKLTYCCYEKPEYGNYDIIDEYIEFEKICLNHD